MSSLDDYLYNHSGLKAGDLSNTEEEKRATTRVICGARACKDAGEAKLVLEMLGLIN